MEAFTLLWSCLRLSTNSIRDAREVLPKDLLVKLQRHCSGVVYVPAQRKENYRHEMVLRLHRSGVSQKQISRDTGYSARWVRHIVAGNDSDRSPRLTSKLYRLVPPDLIGQVQQYAVGRLYVPPRRSKKTSRTKRIEKLFDEGLPAAEIALRMKLSKRQVYRLKKDWSSNSWRREMDNAPGQSQQPNSASDEPFKSRTALKKCPGCGRYVVERGATYCDICKYIKGDDVDGNVIVIDRIPFAAF